MLNERAQPLVEHGVSPWPPLKSCHSERSEESPHFARLGITLPTSTIPHFSPAIKARSKNCQPPKRWETILTNTK